MMGAIRDTRRALADDLAAVCGLRVVTDPRDLSPPCILVDAPTVTVTTVGVCAFEVDQPVLIIAPGPGQEDALDWLLDTVEKVFPVMGAAVANPVVFPVPGGELPAYRINRLLIAQEE